MEEPKTEIETMEDLKLIIEKGPRKGETLEYTPSSVIKIGRVVRGNTIGIKDAGISSKHICIQFDNQLMKWTLIDLDSSNGTILNGQNLKPYVPSGLNDGDCIKIGEFTSIIVKIGLQLSSEVEQNPRRQGKSGGGANINSELNGLGLGFDGDLGENAVVPKRSLRPRGRPRGKKVVDVRVEVESLSYKRNLRSSKKEVKECFVPALNEISENLDVEEREDVAVVIEPKRTRGRRKKLPPKVDKGKEVTKDLEDKQEDDEGLGKEAGPDNARWSDLTKMTLGDFFDYLEVQLPKEIYEKSEKIIADLEEKARKCNEFRLQRNGNGKR